MRRDRPRGRRGAGGSDRRRVGGLDVLVNNAGASFMSGSTTSARRLETIVDINLHGTYHLHTGGRGRAGRGRRWDGHRALGVAAEQSAPYMSHYGAAKAGVSNLTSTLSAEWADRDIRINCIAPGFVATPGVESRWASAPTSSTVRPSSGVSASRRKSPTSRCSCQPGVVVHRRSDHHRRRRPTARRDAARSAGSSSTDGRSRSFTPRRQASPAALEGRRRRIHGGSVLGSVGDRPQPGPCPAVHIVLVAVTDHHGLCRFDPGLPERRFEHRRVRRFDRRPRSGVRVHRVPDAEGPQQSLPSSSSTSLMTP